MRETDLQQHNIRVEAVQHVNGSPYGRYWGYLVVQNGEGEPIYYGKSRSGADRKGCDAFTSRMCALTFAKTLAGDPNPASEEYVGHVDEFDPLWVDTGGES